MTTPDTDPVAPGRRADMTEISAAIPNGGGKVIHLIMPSYRRRRRANPDGTAMCGDNVDTWQRVSVQSASDLLRIGFRRPTWCLTCLGHAVNECGLIEQVIAALVRISSPAQPTGARMATGGD